MDDDSSPSDDEEQPSLWSQSGDHQDDLWGRVNPLYLGYRTVTNNQQVIDALNQLRAVGWVRNVRDGQYEFVADRWDWSG